MVSFKWFNYSNVAFHVLVLSFLLFFFTEIMEMFGGFETFETVLNTLSTLFILSSEIVVFALIWRAK